MTHEEFQTAKSLWKMQYAHVTFKAVQNGVESLLGRELDQAAPEYYSLSVGIICLYCRPFTDTNHVGCISTKIIPAEYRASHKRILLIRNDIFVHLDPGATIGPNQYMNAVKFMKVARTFALSLI